MALLATATLPQVSYAQTADAPSTDAAPPVRHHHVVHHVVHRVPPRYYGAPYYYGTPGNYYPAPPFPLFLLPGPWWLPAHP
jgi:hypothetical protein